MPGSARSLPLCLTALAAALCGAPAAAVTVDWVAVGAPGNACETQPQGCFGAVAAAFQIARTEVTNAQYAEFLNAVAQADPNGLYHTSMASSGAGHGGITRSGSSGSYSYAVVTGRATRPVNYVSFYDALRFANWLHNGQPTGPQGPATTEAGAYAITAPGIADNSIARAAAATVALASEDEWYKAAYYDSAGARYTDYPAGSDAPPVCGKRTDDPPGQANCGDKAGVPGAGAPTDAGTYAAAASASGTFDQGGNLWEWNEATVDGANRGLRGGAFNHEVGNLAAATRSYTVPDAESSVMGFRVVSLPEPGTIPSLLVGVLGLAFLRRRRHRRLAAAVALFGCGLPAAADPDPSLIGVGHRGGSFTWDYCEGKPDATPLPPDPRTLAQPGTNAGKAVHVNTYWKNCHVDPEAVQEVGAAETCGELRERFWHGAQLLDPGSEGPGGLFTGTAASSNGNTSTFSAQMYNQLWTVWSGYTERPANFDELSAERYGSAFSASPNPYPLPGENPNAPGVNGGSGRLPELFTQMRSGEYGTWSSEITVTCHGCHSGNVGSSQYGDEPGLIWGGGSSLADLNLLLRDMLALGWEASAATLLNLNHTRGRNNASLINLAFAAGGGSANSPETFFGVMNSGSTADMDTPAWWNMGHRPAKFADGVFPIDSPRVDAVFYAPTIGITPQGQAWMRDNGPDLNAWVETLQSPPYPSSLPPIDTALAEQGAVLFHTLDLWSRAPERNGAAIPRPEGNGSCASCHGAYAQRYVHDPAFLDSPELEGIAAYIVPLEIIGTDPERLLANNESVQEAGRDSFFGYPPTKDTEQDCGPQNGPNVAPEGRVPGYLAPPLYGVWATAPYLHNGSVPNLWEVLKPSDRKRIWRRVSKPRAPEQADCPTCSVIMGYATDLASSFDAEKVGWRYDEIACQVENATNPSVSPYVNCNPSPEDQQDPLAELIFAGLYSNLLLAWNIVFPPLLTDVQMEDRKIFNTWMFAQGNEGHDFNAVLTDDERRALIEYLKTL